MRLTSSSSSRRSSRSKSRNSSSARPAVKSAWAEPVEDAAAAVPAQASDSCIADAAVADTGLASSKSDNVDVAALTEQLGINPGEAMFAWIPEELLKVPLPSRWASQQDPETGLTFYVDTDLGNSQWEHPLLLHLLQVVDIGHLFLENPAEGFFEQQALDLWHARKRELECWHGPFTDAEGNSYFSNSQDGISSWQDPRIDAQFVFEVQVAFLSVLRSYVPSALGDTLNSFGGGSPWEADAEAEVLAEFLTPRRNAGGSFGRMEGADRTMDTTGGSSATWVTACSGSSSSWALQTMNSMGSASSTVSSRLSPKLTQISLALASADLNKAATETFQNMRTESEKLHTTMEDEQERQRLQLLRKAELRKERKEVQKSRPDAVKAYCQAEELCQSTLRDDEELQMMQMTQRLEERRQRGRRMTLS